MLRLLAMLLLLAGPAVAADKVAFGLDWQALATGIYAKHGVDVSIRQGGPQLDQSQLLLADAGFSSYASLISDKLIVSPS